MPAARLQERTLLSLVGPCLSPSRNLRTSSASWSALPWPVSAPFDQAGRGVNLFVASRRVQPLFGPFAETKGPRLPGRNPATQIIMLIRDLGPSAMHSPASTFFWKTRRWIPNTHPKAIKPKQLILYVPEKERQKWRQTFMNVLRAF
jgi:hypothetical protein